MKEKFVEMRSISLTKLIISYLLSLGTCIIGIYIVFRFRSTLATLLAVSPLTHWVHQLIQIAAYIILGLVWVVLIFLTQYWYENEFRKGWRFSVFFLVTSLEVLFIFLCDFLTYLAIPKAYLAPDILYMVMELIIAVGLFAVYKVLKVR